jgi:hypothetical protein
LKFNADRLVDSVRALHFRFEGRDMRRVSTLLSATVAITAILISTVHGLRAAATTPPVTDKPYLVEWVYKVKWGHADEFFDIFKKYQIRILDREKELGSVLQYTVYRPGLHASEDQRWDYRVLVVYKNQQATSEEAVVEKQLFPDRAAFKRDENRRWELIDAHWDLPIREIDPHAADN